MKIIIRSYLLVFFLVINSCLTTSCSVGIETVKLPLLSCQIELLLPKNEFLIKKDNYDEGVIYTLYFRRGAYIVAFEGALMQFLPEDTLSAFQIKKHKRKTVFTGVTDNLYWRNDSIGNVRLFYNRVAADSRKSFDKILNSAKIIKVQ